MYRILPPRLIVATACIAIVDIYFLRWLLPPAFAIDLWVILLIFYYLYHNERRALIFSLWVGFFADLLGRGIFGVAILSMWISSLILIRFASMINREKAYVQMVTGFLMCVSVLSIELFLTCLIRGKWIWLSHFSPWILTSAFTTAIATPFILKLMEKFLGVHPRQYELFPR